MLHTYNEDLRKHSRHIKLQLKGVQEAHKDWRFEQCFEEEALIDVLQRMQGNFDWIVMNRNGYRGSINKQKYVGHHTSEVLERVNNNLIIIN